MKLLSLVVVACIWDAVLFAASPLGSVSSAGPLYLSGTRVSASSVSSWPVVAGDVITTSKLPAVIFLKDKSRVTLQPNTSVRLEVVGSRTDVHLLQGNLLYTAISQADLRFVVGVRRITPVAGVQSSLSASSAAPAATRPPDYGTARMAVVPNPSNVDPF